MCVQGEDVLCSLFWPSPKHYWWLLLVPCSPTNWRVLWMSSGSDHGALDNPVQEQAQGGGHARNVLCVTQQGRTDCPIIPFELYNSSMIITSVWVLGSVFRPLRYSHFPHQFSSLGKGTQSLWRLYWTVTAQCCCFSALLLSGLLSCSINVDGLNSVSLILNPVH